MRTRRSGRCRGARYAAAIAEPTPPIDPEPRLGPESALPSVLARALAFAGVFLGGLAGAIIGYSFATIQCATDGCTLSRGLFLWLGSLAGAIGAAVVAMLTLRALGEWRSVRSPK